MKFKHRFKCRFTGRKIGAIGIFHPVEIEVEARDGEDALLACYETHEHISQFECELVERETGVAS